MGKISKDIFGGSLDSEDAIKTENQYAKNYDIWRKKEELNKLKTKYGEEVLEGTDSTSSSDDDEDAAELTEEVEKDFFKTLSYLKKKDPKIYDNNVNFFNPPKERIKKEKKVKEQPMYLKDYERELLLEKGGVFSDEDNSEIPRPSTYAKEQEHIKEEIIKLGANIEEDEDDDGALGGLLEPRKKTKEEESQKEAEYLKWLQGQTDEMNDGEIKSELTPLKDYWNNPNLDSGEKFLRDYVLKKRYLEKDEDEQIPTYNEIIHDSDSSLSGDEGDIEKQEEFEHKYNFRFEEPDQEFIKRYPRTIGQSLRKTDDRRKLKREETKQRKKREKEEKMAEIKKLQELKRKEIEEKIEKLKKVTGTTDLPFHDEDIDGDFDPEAHDKRMQTLFNDEFYEGPEGDQKPSFPDLDEELEIENWDHWNGEDYKEDSMGHHQLHCDDDDFNMDADYNPSTALKEELIENTKGKKKRRRKSKVAEALCRPKPKFDVNDKNYEKYFDEYYKLDCEDIIGNIPCRFKYREVMANDFGLTIEEILLAKDKELNRWCSLKKTVQRRPENVEKYDQIAYSKKANNINLKKKLIPSLFSDEPDEEKSTQKPSTSRDKSSLEEAEDQPKILLSDDVAKPDNIDKATPNVEVKKRENKKKNKKKQQNTEIVVSNQTKAKESKSGHSKEGDNTNETKNMLQNNNKKKIKKRKRIDSDSNNKPGGKKAKNNKEPNLGISDSRLSAFGINPKKFKNKLKYGNKNKN